MSAPTMHLDAPQVGVTNLRLQLKPAHQAYGFVQGAWWPRSDQLDTELPPLLEGLSLRLGRIGRVIYDDNGWAPAPSRIEFRNGASTLFGSRHQSIDTLSVIGEHGRLNLLVVPPYTDPTVAYSAVMTAASPNNHSTPEDLLGISAKEATDRRQALIAHQRWESDGGAVPRNQHHDHAEASGGAGTV